MATWITHIMHAKTFPQVITNLNKQKVSQYSKTKMIVQALMFKKNAPFNYTC